MTNKLQYEIETEFCEDCVKLICKYKFKTEYTFVYEIKPLEGQSAQEYLQNIIKHYDAFIEEIRIKLADLILEEFE